MPNQIVVYTAIFGAYDPLREQPKCPGVDWVVFTDNQSLPGPDHWRRVSVKPRFNHPRMSAKWFKLRPEKVLRDYHYTIWIDASIAIGTATFVEQLLSCMDGTGIALFRHPDRDNVFDEVAVSEPLPKYAGLPLRSQVAHYVRKGYPGTNGLYAGGILARDNRSRRIRHLNRLWMRENIRWTYQDQLSLPYLLWKLGITPGVVPFNLWDNPLFQILPHTSDL